MRKIEGMYSTDLEKRPICPSCGEEREAATHAKGDAVEPEPGDFSVCFNCGAVSQFTAEMTYKLYTFDKGDGVPPMQKAELRRLSEHVKKFRLNRKKN